MFVVFGLFDCLFRFCVAVCVVCVLLFIFMRACVCAGPLLGGGVWAISMRGHWLFQAFPVYVLISCKFSLAFPCSSPVSFLVSFFVSLVLLLFSPAVSFRCAVLIPSFCCLFVSIALNAFFGFVQVRSRQAVS